MIVEMTLTELRFEEDLVKLTLRTPGFASYWESTFYLADGFITKDPSEAKQISRDSIDANSLETELMKNPLPFGSENSATQVNLHLLN